ncbi:hypothetical protein LguiB_020900 [Lonicera macranthoides]
MGQESRREKRTRMVIRDGDAVWNKMKRSSEGPKLIRRPQSYKTEQFMNLLKLGLIVKTTEMENAIYSQV